MASSYTYDLQFRTKRGMEKAFLTINITADAAAGTVDAFSTDDMTYMSQTLTDVLKGFNFMWIDTIPGSGGDAPDSTYTVAITDGSTPALTVVSIAAASTTAKERALVSDTISFWEDVNSVLNFAIGDLGNSNKTSLVLVFKQD